MNIRASLSLSGNWNRRERALTGLCKLQGFHFVRLRIRSLVVSPFCFSLSEWWSTCCHFASAIHAIDFIRLSSASVSSLLACHMHFYLPCLDKRTFGPHVLLTPSICNHTPHNDTQPRLHPLSQPSPRCPGERRLTMYLKQQKQKQEWHVISTKANQMRRSASPTHVLIY